jgi:ABC-type glycerol-3-phosphate transport system substrate-binding protein
MASLNNHKTRTTYSRRGVIGGGVALASAAMLGTSWIPRRTFAAQVSGDISVRFFPFGTGVEELYGTFKDEFEAQNPDVSVNLDLQPWDNRYPKMLADIAAGRADPICPGRCDRSARIARSGGTLGRLRAEAYRRSVARWHEVVFALRSGSAALAGQ